MAFKKLKFPSAQTILLLIAALVAIMTWFVPSGQYDRLRYDNNTGSLLIEGQGAVRQVPAEQGSLMELGIEIPIEKFTSGDIYKPINVPGTYHTLKWNPQGVAAWIKSPVRGIIEAADIIFLVLIIGGLIGVMNSTGAFNAGIYWLAGMLKGREFLLIILVTILIAIGGTTFGLAEETIAFFPILIPVFIAAGYDGMVGLACIFMGSAVGTMCSTVNPFSTIIASDAAGLNWTVGLEGRVLMWLLCVTVTIIYILRYARRVKRDPSQSVVFDKKKQIESLFGVMATEKSVDMTNRLRLIILLFSACFVVMVIGVSFLDWWFVEMTATFLSGAILIGIIGRIKESTFVESFSKGAADLLSVAFIIGIARGVSIIMDDGLISDTMLHYASGVTADMSKGLFINVIFIIYNGLSFFIPSSSGMAVLTMPIMSPLADGVGIGRELVVNAYQYGMGLFYIINPTGLILASLAIVRIGFNRWIRFVMPLFVILTLIIMIFLTVGAYGA